MYFLVKLQCIVLNQQRSIKRIRMSGVVRTCARNSERSLKYTNERVVAHANAKIIAATAELG